MSYRIKSLEELPTSVRALNPSVVPVSPQKPSKYRNVRTEFDGEKYDSKLESRCAQWLLARAQMGEVAWFTRQVPFKLAKQVYRADFLAVLTTGGVEVIDATGFLTPIKKIKIAEVYEKYGVEVILWPAEKSHG